MDNRAFWNQRYIEQAWLGSGIGSRAVAAAYKAWLIKTVISRNKVYRVTDIGCGDLCWLDQTITPPAWLNSTRYKGVDISDQVVEQNRVLLPSATFNVHDIVRSPVEPKSDLVICFDVLIHQIDKAQFDAALVNILESTNRTALVSYFHPDFGNPNFKDVIPDVKGFDYAKEVAFKQLLRERRERCSIPYGATAHFGDLSKLILAHNNAVRIRPIGAYRCHLVYEITQSDWLDLRAQES